MIGFRKNLAMKVAIFVVSAVLAAGASEDIKIVKINDDNFEKEILHSKKPVILEVSSTSCPPCLVMIPTLIGIAKNYSDIKIASIGIDEPNIEKIKNTLPIRAFPTFFFIKDGRIINRITRRSRMQRKRRRANRKRRMHTRILSARWMASSMDSRIL